MQFCTTMQKNCERPWINNKVEYAISEKRQALKRFREIPNTSNETRLLIFLRKQVYC